MEFSATQLIICLATQLIICLLCDPVGWKRSKTRTENVGSLNRQEWEETRGSHIVESGTYSA